jgi:hydroxypyruvate isomerase
MDRRSFLAAGAAAAVTAGINSNVIAADTPKKSNAAKFKLKYAPHLKHFNAHAGKDPIDNIKFIADEGFTAIFDNGFPKKSKDLQKKIVDELAKRNMTMGPFVLYADFKTKSFVLNDKDIRKMLVEKMHYGVEICKRCNIKWTLVVPGKFDEKLDWSYQTANVIENLKYCAEVFEKEDKVIVLEPLNSLKNHPGLFLKGIPQSYMVCKSVNSPAVKIVNDLYHQQITEGNLISNIDMAWSEIAAYHLGDNPGRKEPTTGEINFKNIFKHLYKKKYDGVLCTEHGLSKGKGKEAERAMIDAYRYCDNF